MRIQVHQLRGKPGVHHDTVEDVLCDELAKHYTVIRRKSFIYVDGAGRKQVLVADVVLPKHSLIVEVQKKQDNKGIIAEMAREKVARDHGWGVCRFNEKEIAGDIDNVLYKIQREIERRSRSEG